MKLVEVVMLMGAHCVSPVEQSQMMTVASKVQCAVVIEKDTDTGTLTVKPREAAADPVVAAAVARFAAAPVDPFSRGDTRIVPARAPAGASTVEMKLPATPAAVPPPVSPAGAAAESLPTDPTIGVAARARAEPDVATLAPARPPRPSGRAEPAQRQPAKTKEAKVKSKATCKGAAVAKWYTAAGGHRKYRCVRPEPASDTTPAQLY